MDDNTRKKLIDKGAGALADALISLAGQNDLAADVVERLSSDQSELIKKVKRKISGLKRRKAFIHWRESGKFADHIEAILTDIKAAEPDPETGLGLLAAFYETDKAVFNNCDDSSGHISIHYKVIAPNMFAMYASDCADKKMVLDLLIKLYSDDDFSLREGLIEKTCEMIGLHETLNSIHLFEMLEEQEEDEYQKYHYQRAILSLARQTHDPQLFERTTLKYQPQPGAAAILDIAEVYLASGEPGIANEWVGKIPEGDIYMADKRDNLLLLIYKALGNPEKLEKTAWKKFRARRSLDSLNMLLEVIGEDKREQIIEDEAYYIIDEEKEANYNDIQFLIDTKQFDEADICILVKAGTGKLDGYLYPILLPIAKAMEKEERFLSAYVIYRELMLSILDRKFYKGYSHAAKYLRKLNALSEKIEDWQDLGNHQEFLNWLEVVHGKKSSFWRHYRG
ncbi:MAG: hypothetical protein P1P82_15125 [Bacteroidales bacterium]|nr:hypothetical protein [Bacteroidales bacterium]MDT8430686.1 hypothetical protein [Bacteroidales bacterium]